MIEKTLYSTYEGRCACQGFDYYTYTLFAQEDGIQPLSEDGYYQYAAIVADALYEDGILKQLH